MLRLNRLGAALATPLRPFAFQSHRGLASAALEALKRKGLLVSGSKIRAPKSKDIAKPTADNAASILTETPENVIGNSSTGSADSMKPTLDKSDMSSLELMPSIVKAIRQQQKEWVPGETPWWETVLDCEQHVEGVREDLFNIHDWRPNQREAVLKGITNQDIFLVLPPGAGKTLCFQLPALLTKGVTIVVSPLIALMREHEQRLQSLGIPVASITGSTPAAQKRKILGALQHGSSRVKFVYTTPEQLVKNSYVMDVVQAMADSRRLQRIVIDEAHCVSEWGSDFRPSYRQLAVVRERFSHIPITCATGSATQAALKDIEGVFKLRRASYITGQLARPNLMYAVQAKGRNSPEYVAGLINGPLANLPGIIYCMTQRECEQVAEALQLLDVNALPYHAGLKKAERSGTQRKFDFGECLVLVTTTAFGMGMDKGDVAFIIHYSTPFSLEAYYQETGRAGRDNLPSLCLMLFKKSDLQRATRLHRLSAPDMEDMDSLQSIGAFRPASNSLPSREDQLDDVLAFAKEKSVCRHRYLTEHFGQAALAASCLTTCDVCYGKQGKKAVVAFAEQVALARNGANR